MAQKGSFEEEGVLLSEEEIVEENDEGRVSSIYLFIVMQAIVTICDKSFLCVTFLCERNSFL